MQANKLDDYLKVLVKKMNTSFKQADFFRQLGTDEVVMQEVLKHNLVGAAYKDCFESLCDFFNIKKEKFLKEEPKK